MNEYSKKDYVNYKGTLENGKPISFTVPNKNLESFKQWRESFKSEL